MPLHDHFHPPLQGRRDWHAFHHAWATYLAADVNHHLPEGYFAEPNIHFGIEIDVAALDENGKAPATGTTGGWTPPAPVITAPFAVITDIVEIRVFRNEDGPILAGAIELVSPSNKDRPSERDAFVAKCLGYLHGGAGLLIVDIVTERRANLHEQLLARLPLAGVPPLTSPLYATAYRPVQQEADVHLEIWQEALAIGGRLPTLPLGLRGGLRLPVDLEATYNHTCRELRITANGA